MSRHLSMEVNIMSIVHGRFYTLSSPIKNEAVIGILHNDTPLSYYFRAVKVVVGQSVVKMVAQRGYGLMIMSVSLLLTLTKNHTAVSVIRKAVPMGVADGGVQRHDAVGILQ